MSEQRAAELLIVPIVPCAAGTARYQGEGQLAGCSLAWVVNPREPLSACEG